MIRASDSDPVILIDPTGGAHVIGIVLAAGAGRRLRPVTDGLPKALAPVDGERTILDFTLDALASHDVREVVVVVGYAAEQVEARVPDLEARHGVRLTLVHNSRAEDWNNAFSLWCAREHFSAGFLLANGDTLHTPEIEHALLQTVTSDVVLALDDLEELAEEQMKVRLDADGAVACISKLIDPATADGEYIGVACVPGTASDALADALETTWKRDPSLYYEDAFQEMVDRGLRIEVATIGSSPWTEVDDHTDLARARELACQLSSG
jgi:choline kinase